MQLSEINTSTTQKMDTGARQSKTDDIDVNGDAIRGKITMETEDSNTTRIKPPENTGSDSVRMRNYRAAVVCLVLLCVLLLVAVIVLGVIRAQGRNNLHIKDMRVCYGSACYYISKKKKTWTESRKYCTERGADLIIINNREEQDIVKSMSGDDAVWIGLTDIDVEGTWKWVDGSTLTSGFRFWTPGDPSGRREENCAMSVAVPWPEFNNGVGWHDVACNIALRWICKKRV
ncbi:CD209 antigen-like protein D [Labeo rohita]|uniref:CD209 antigen-like protein D n=1 Tax=Labeo rohita TaxID=84645 RepID=UPI0021E24E4C|nr:CD209 antigen-like protein D [Labeo rohita]